MNVVLVGGVPGAGKSTAIKRVAELTPEVVALDPDQAREWLRARLPTETPYRLYRPVVHTGHMVRVLWRLLQGPVDGQVLVVHDPATRPVRRQLFARLAKARGWHPSLLVVDVSKESALSGQLERRRVVAAPSFTAHWERWLDFREQLIGADPVAIGDWERVSVAGRAEALATLRALCAAPASEPADPGVRMLAA